MPKEYKKKLISQNLLLARVVGPFPPGPSSTVRTLSRDDVRQRGNGNYGLDLRFHFIYNAVIMKIRHDKSQLNPAPFLCLLLAIVAMLGLECFEIIHTISDRDCPTHHGGDVTECPYCTTFSFLFAESAAPFTPPVPVTRELFIVTEEPFLRPVITSTDYPARSPPDFA